VDYAPEKTAEKGWKVIDHEINKLEGFGRKEELKERIERIKQGERDLYF